MIPAKLTIHKRTDCLTLFTHLSQLMQRCFLVLLLLCCFQCITHAQEPTLKITDPTNSENAVSKSTQFIVGSTCTNCTIRINDSAVKVYPTGAFAIELQLKEGENNYTIEAKNAAGKKKTKSFRFTYQLPKPEQAVSSPVISYIQTFPEGDLTVRAGDEINFKANLKYCRVIFSKI